ncbi:hypothetical protein EV175_002217 [Coemansia sp. RSA 1933]|nr:hypothetical protein EV175_002217 [Coemansia sp. RSA 1933]
MRVPFSDRGMRDSTAIPTMTCAQCSKEVHIRLIGEHECLGRPEVPDLPPGMNSRQLSSFFDAPEPTSRPPVSRYNNPHDMADARKAVESRMFPAAYKPSLQLLSEDAGGNDEFDFDEMLNNASSFRPGTMSNDSLSDGVISPGPRKIPVFNNSNSSLSFEGLSPYDALASARRDNGEQLSARSNGSEYSAKGDARPKPNVAASQNSLMQNMTSEAAVSQGQQQQKQQQPDSPTEPPVSGSSSSAFSLSTVASPVNPTSVPSRAAPPPPPPPPRTAPSAPPAPPVQRQRSVGSEGTGTMAQSSDTSHYHHQDQKGQKEEGKRKQQEQASQHKAPPDKGRYLHRKTSSSARGLEATSPVSATVPSGITAAANKAESSRGHDNGSSLSIGNMMKAQTTKTRRGGDAANGPIVRRQQQGSSPTSPTSPTYVSGSEGGSGISPRWQQTVGGHSPIAMDNQIRISAKRPQLGGQSGSYQESSTFSSPLHEPNSYPSDTSSQSMTLRSKEEQQRKLTRTATAPASMNKGPSSSSSGHLHTPADGAGAGGKARATANPFDVLASLVPLASGGAAHGKTPGLAASIPPHINTQVNGRLGAGSHMRKMSGPRSGGGNGPKSHKSAKLDSLLDDLMGEMQALNVEVRSESDRESMVSTASLGNSMSSPYEVAREHPLRGRFDSTVSTASTSSTLSTGGGVGGMQKQRQVHCVTCGVGISTNKNAVLRSSGLRSASDIPASVQGIEHQGRLFCVRDYKRHLATSTRCQGCGNQCEPQSSKETVSALDGWWHRGCFNCQECHKAFPDKSFYVFENRPYCRYDYHKLNKSLCVACHEPIEGPCAQVFEGRFHPACFACYQCGEPLRDVYYSLDGSFLCEDHVHKHKSNRSANKRMTVFGHV